MSASDVYTVDYSTTSGKYSRWYAINWGRDYPNMQTNDEKGLTLTALPLKKDVVVTGHPVVHLWLATEASNLDVFAYLEEIDKEETRRILRKDTSEPLTVRTTNGRMKISDCLTSLIT